MADIDSLIAIKTEGDTQDQVQIKLVDAAGTNMAAVADGKLDVLAHGYDGSSNQVLLTDAGGRLQVDVTGSSGTPVNDYDTGEAIKNSGTPFVSNYPATSGKTLSLKRVIASGSGPIKVEVATGVVASEVAVATGFTLAGQNCIIEFNDLPVASTDNVKVTVWDRDSKDQDVFVTIQGSEI